MKGLFKILIIAISLTLGVSFVAYPQQKKGKVTQTQQKNSKKSSAASSKKGNSKTKSTAKSGAKKGSSSKNRKGGGSVKNKAETSADVKKRQESTNREIQLTKQQIAENEKSVKKGLSELGKLETSIGESTRKVEATQREVSDLDRKIAKLETDIADNERTLNFMRDQYKKAIKKVRGSQRGNSTLSFIFSSDNFNQALRRMRYLRKFSEWKDKRSKEISAKVETLRQQTALLDGTRTDMRSALSRQQAAKRDLETKYQRQDALVADLKRNGDALKSHLQKKQAEANQLKSRISELIAAEQRAEQARLQEEARKQEEAKKQEEARKREQERLLAKQQAAEAEKEKEKASKEVASAEKKPDKKSEKKSDKKKEDKKGGKDKNASQKSKNNSGSDKSYADARKRRSRKDAQNGSVPKETKPEVKRDSKSDNNSTTPSAGGASFEKMRGSLPRPVAGTFNITSRFGRHSLPDLPEVMYDNPGIDAEVAPGATATAVFGGKVSGVYRIPGYSTVVIVNHGNYYTVYGNIASPAVKVGDQVAQGKALGSLAPDEEDPSRSTIHFEVWKNREKLNPTDWIR